MKKLVTTILLAVLISNVFAVALVAAQTSESQFTATQLVTSSPDTTPPSVPLNLTATPVSTSQINLSWSASTDNTSVAGYQIFRDGVFVATSTVVTYSDTGLTANTLYSYNVTAFDPSVNISAQSATATATTFPLPTTSGGNNGGSGGGGSDTNGSVIVLKYLSVSPDLRSTLIQFGTNIPVQATVSWGKTADYELGVSTDGLFLADHSVHLDGLTPSTHYFFKIEFVDGLGRQLVIENQEFVTLSLPDITAPANVTNFLATPNEKNIVLTWKNPKADFDIVRIVKSDKFYPKDPLDGEVIYEGRAEQFVDSRVVLDTTYYYTAFSRDASGNYSSGAVTDGALLHPGEKLTLPKLFANIIQLPKELIDSLLKKLSVADIDFIQDGQKLPVVGNTVDIRGDRNLTISIDYAKVPEILKTIVVTMFDPEDTTKTFSFLLRVNADKTAYQANVAALERPGKYQFSLAILDHKHQGLALLAGTIFSNVPNLIAGKAANPFAHLFTDWMSIVWLVLALLIMAVALRLFLRGSKEKQL